MNNNGSHWPPATRTNWIRTNQKTPTVSSYTLHTHTLTHTDTQADGVLQQTRH